MEQINRLVVLSYDQIDSSSGNQTSSLPAIALEVALDIRRDGRVSERKLVPSIYAFFIKDFP